MTTAQKQQARNRKTTADYRKSMREKYPEWKVWESMKERCYRVNHRYYEYYGGKGIEVCDRWRVHKKGFYNFLEDMGRKPSDWMDLDRIDSNENYCKENCRWLDRSENRARANRKIEPVPTVVPEEELEEM